MIILIISEAAFKVAYENNIISYDEYIMYSKINYNETYVSRLEQKHVGSKKIAVTAKPKAPDFIIHNVYSIIKENCSLSEEDYKTLKTSVIYQTQELREIISLLPLTGSRKKIS